MIGNGWSQMHQYFGGTWGVFEGHLGFFGGYVVSIWGFIHTPVLNNYIVLLDMWCTALEWSIGIPVLNKYIYLPLILYWMGFGRQD